MEKGGRSRQRSFDICGKKINKDRYCAYFHGRLPEALTPI
jgi:hypothetical protein